MMPTFFELFAGAGGMSMGLEMAGWRCIGHAEIEPHARAVLRHHWPDTPLHGDVAQIDGTALRGVTMITGGSPCQDLSVAGKRAGMTQDSGTRSSLFFEQVRIWHESEAPFILWENVYGAFSSQQGRDFAAVLSAIVGAAVPVPADGWRSAGVASGPAGVAAWRTLDAQYFGVPQRRRRVFVLGVRGGGVDPAEVLSLAESLSGHFTPSQAAGESIAVDVGKSLASESGQGHWDDSGLARLRAQGGGSPQNVVYDNNSTIAFDNRPHVNESGIHNTLTAQALGNPASVLAIDIYNQSISPDGIAHTIRAMNTGEGIPHTASVIAFDAYNQSDTGTISKTLNVGSDYSHTTIVLRNREGKPGGGKGPLLSAERERTLGTANDQVLFPSVAPTITWSNGNQIADALTTTSDRQLMPDKNRMQVVCGTLNATDAEKWGSNQWVNEGKIIHTSVPRRLTPIECERLMGWPDQHTAHGINEKGRAYDLPDTGRYKLCGNGIASPVVAWIGFQLRDALDRSSQ